MYSGRDDNRDRGNALPRNVQGTKGRGTCTCFFSHVPGGMTSFFVRGYYYQIANHAVSSNFSPPCFSLDYCKKKQLYCKKKQSGITIKNCPPALDKRELKQAFKDVGEVEFVELDSQEHTAWVNFRSKRDAY